VKDLKDKIFQDEFDQVFKSSGGPEPIIIPKTTTVKKEQPLQKQQSRQELDLMESDDSDESDHRRQGLSAMIESEMSESPVRKQRVTKQLQLTSFSSSKAPQQPSSIYENKKRK
jgi:hypothetical protein